MSLTTRAPVPLLWGVVAATILFGAGCRSGRPSAPEIRVSPGAPERAWSPGVAALTVDIEAIDAKGQPVSVPIGADELRFLEADSIRLARWDENEGLFELIDGSRFDAQKGALEATLTRGGRYGVLGFSRWTHIYGFQRRLCDPEAFGLTLGPQIIDRLCLVILCAPFDAGAWGRAWQDQMGESIPPEAMGAHFGDICERCTRGIPRLPAPECGIGVLEPGGGSTRPPELEQIPNGIENGGRAVAIGIRPGDDDEMLVASETGGLFRSSNRGLNWSHVSADHTFDFSDVQYYPPSSDVIVASARRDSKVSNGGGIWRSDDGGASWTQRSLGPVIASCADELSALGLDYEAEEDELWAATTCGVAHSDDDGVTWAFLPAAPGYNHDKSYAIVTPESGNLKLLTDAGVKVTTDGGATWAVSSTGLPGGIAKGVHNQIAVSPFDPSHIYWAFNYPKWDPEAGEAGDWRGRWALYLSIDDGSSWSSLVDEWGLNRPPFVRLGGSPSGSENEYVVYYGNGGGTFQRATATHGSPPSLSAWTALTAVGHCCDISDLAFGNDGSTPLLLAGDGGLYRTADDGLTWTFTGGVNAGYNALQITEVTGQMDSLLGTDLYFATQDNDIWASPDGGVTWPGRRRFEGFYLGIPRQPLPAADTRFTGVSCAGCGNFISGPILSAQSGFPNPPNNDGNPKLIEPGSYLHRTKIAGVDSPFFDLTQNTGGSWVTRFGFPEPSMGDLPKFGGAVGNPTIFTTFKDSGVTPAGQPIIGIKRITDVLGTGTPVVMEVAGFGSLGIFPTMFAWYKPYGVHPDDPNHLLVPDVIDGVVKVTTDGGAMWTPDTDLTDLVTRGGDFRFSWRFGNSALGQVSTIAFDPDCPGKQILVGTAQAGIFRSLDGGATWGAIAGSERIPRVSSFFFGGDGTVYLSSYGRGLWKLRSRCPGIAGPPTLPPYRMYVVPMVYFDGVLFPLSSIDDPEACPTCFYALARGGEILDYAIDTDRKITSVSLSGGELVGYTTSRKQIKHLDQDYSHLSAQSHGRELQGKDERLIALLEAGNQIRGLYLEGERLKGLLVASREISAEDLPTKKELGPYIVVRVPVDGGVSANRVSSIVVVGYGFARDAPIEVSVDGVPLEVDEEIYVDDDGTFQVLIPPILGVGGHTVRVEQRVGQEVFRDAYSFNVTVEDLPREDPEPR